MKTLGYVLTAVLGITTLVGCDGDSCLTNPSKCPPGYACVAASDGLWECQKINKQGSRLQSREPASEVCDLGAKEVTDESQMISRPQ